MRVEQRDDSRRLRRVAAGLAVFMSLLAGCETTYNPNVTGSQGGLLPGMTRPDPPKGQEPAAVTPDTQLVTLPDGRFVRTETLGGVVYARAWLTPQGVPQTIIFYQNGLAAAQEDYDAAGLRTRVTRWFPGTEQIAGVEEYAEGTYLLRKASYWPGGARRTLTEYGVQTADGPVNRLQSWQENGKPKAKSQVLVVSGAREVTHGRQTEWDESGVIIYDVEYNRGILVRDYLADVRRPARQGP